MGSLVDVQDVHVAFDQISVLEGASLTVNPGEHTLILGPSGSGKTTLLNVLARLVEPTRGDFTFREQPVAAQGSPARFRRQHIGYVFQELHLLESLTVEQNIGLVQAAMGAGDDAPSPRELLEPLGLGDRRHARVAVLSRGERQRVALARAFANRPALVLADEPTSSLDPSNRATTLGHLWRLCEQTGATAVVVSHDEALRSDDHFARRLSLDEGTLTALVTG